MLRYVDARAEVGNASACFWCAFLVLSFASFSPLFSKSHLVVFLKRNVGIPTFTAVVGSKWDIVMGRRSGDGLRDWVIVRLCGWMVVVKWR